MILKEKRTSLTQALACVGVLALGAGVGHSADQPCDSVLGVPIGPVTLTGTGGSQMAALAAALATATPPCAECPDTTDRCPHDLTVFEGPGSSIEFIPKQVPQGAPAEWTAIVRLGAGSQVNQDCEECP